MQSNLAHIPEDVVACILEELTGPGDLYRCALVNHSFHAAAIPLLYRRLDVRVPSFAVDALQEIHRVHASTTILQKPWYGSYVFHIIVDVSVLATDTFPLQDHLSALELCTNLRSFSWTDRNAYAENDPIFLAHLYILQRLQVVEITVNISSGISAPVWGRLCELEGLKSFGVWSSHYKTNRSLNTWAARLGTTLRSLEFSIASYASQHPHFLSHMPHLQRLVIDAPSNSIPAILASHPHLTALDVRYRTVWHHPPSSPTPPAAARLQHLTVHIVHNSTAGLWAWLLALAPHAGTLRALTLDSRVALAPVPVPRTFLAQLAAAHGGALRQLHLYNLALAPDDAAFALGAFRALEDAAFGVPDAALAGLTHAVHEARNLTALAVSVGTGATPALAYARRWMSRAHDSRLRTVCIGQEVFRGHWTRDGAAELVFEVYKDEGARSRWL